MLWRVFSSVVAGLPGCGKSFVSRLVLGLPGMDLGEAVRSFMFDPRTYRPYA